MTASSALDITHIQGIFSPEHGGPCFSLSNYCRGQVARGHHVRVRVLEGYPHTSPALRLDPPVDWRACRVDAPSRLGASRELRGLLARDPTPDLYHLHGVWLRAMHYGANEARRRDKPYVVELMGAYERYARLQKGLTKQFARWWFQDALLRRAGCLHVNSAKEGQELRELGFRAPIAVIPVGTDTRNVSPVAEHPPPGAGEIERRLGKRPFVLYLARLHRNKGIELLLRAWAEVARQFPNCLLVVAGSGSAEYVEQCRRLADGLQLEDRCLWLGQISEAEKGWLYAHAELYVLPSYSENFGNTVAEALAHGTPVLTTPHTVWTNLPAEGCGWLADTTVESLGGALVSALQTAPAQLRVMGQRGQRLIESHYSLNAVMNHLDRMYRWLLGGPEPTDILL